MNSLDITQHSIDDDCIGLKWSVKERNQLAKIIAVILMGQARHASQIIKTLAPALPQINEEFLREEAINKLTVHDTNKPGIGYPQYQRDGLIFEVISWVAAKQVLGDNCYLKAPHISSTTQGLDGLMIELNSSKTKLKSTTIFEDKCTENPRNYFRDEVLPCFITRHQNKNSADLIACASSLIEVAGIPEAKVTKIASKVLDIKSRSYRAGFALDPKFVDTKKIKKLFKNYDRVQDIQSKQRIAGYLIIDSEGLREWFDEFADLIIKCIIEFEDESV